MLQIILPKRRYTNLDPTIPLFFFMGPMRGSGNWHHGGYHELAKRCEDGYVAIPYYHSRLHQYPFLTGVALGDGEPFLRQTHWEREYLKLASKRGCIICWLGKESADKPRVGGPYARDTYGEVGEWRGHMMHDPNVNFVLGGDPDFPGLSQIKANFDDALECDFPVYSTLVDTIKAGLAKAGVQVVA
jgi:hypothetical protein